MKTVDASIGVAEKIRDYMLLKHTNYKVKQYAALSKGEELCSVSHLGTK